MHAGRRKVLNGGRNAGALGKRAAKGMQDKFKKGFNGLKTSRRRVVRQVERDCDGELPFVAVSFDRKKRRVVSGPARMAMLRSNKNYLPGD